MIAQWLLILVTSSAHFTPSSCDPPIFIMTFLKCWEYMTFLPLQVYTPTFSKYVRAVLFTIHKSTNLNDLILQTNTVLCLCAASVAVISSRYLQGAHTSRSYSRSDHGRERETKVAGLFFLWDNSPLSEFLFLEVTFCTSLKTLMFDMMKKMMYSVGNGTNITSIPMTCSMCSVNKTLFPVHTKNKISIQEYKKKTGYDNRKCRFMQNNGLIPFLIFLLLCSHIIFPVWILMTWIEYKFSFFVMPCCCF